MNIREKLEKDFEMLEQDYTTLIELKWEEENKANPDNAYLDVLKSKRISIIDRECYIKELLEILDNETN